MLCYVAAPTHPGGEKMKQLMTATETAEYLRHAPQTLAKWRVHGNGPRWHKLGRSIFYDRADVDEWIDSKVRRSTCE
jgi:predicted DNA-binding transcriptional regulator AlpA